MKITNFVFIHKDEVMSRKKITIIIICCSMKFSLIFSQEKIGRFVVGVQSGVLVPFGTPKGITAEQMGISNGLSFKYFPNDYFAMGMSIRMMNNSFQGQTKATDVPISQVPFTFDFEWYPTNWRLKPYAGFGGGLSFFTVTPVAGLVNTLKEIPDTYTTPAYLATVKAGLKFQLNYHFSVHAEGTYYLVGEPGQAFVWQQNDGTAYRQFPYKGTLTIGLFYHFDE